MYVQCYQCIDYLQQTICDSNRARRTDTNLPCVSRSHYNLGCNLNGHLYHAGPKQPIVAAIIASTTARSSSLPLHSIPRIIAHHLHR